MSPGDLAEILSELPLERDPNLIVGAETCDDAGVYKLTKDIALIQTLDFFTPIVNDPHDFGKIAAANSLSDVYSMGGRPLTAMNIVCFPVKEMKKQVLKQIIAGGLEIVHQAGAVLLGGHSVQDPELKFGLSVTGIVHPDKIVANSGAIPGDLLVLTKPLGTGILATALKAGMLEPATIRYVTDLMASLNKGAAEAMVQVGVNAATDITGFGLIGHAIEMAMASNVSMRIHATNVPIIPEALTFASIGMIPEGTHKNRSFCACRMQVAKDVDSLLIDILTDAQTSGGLLISVSKERLDALLNALEHKACHCHQVVGEVIEGEPGKIFVDL